MSGQTPMVHTVPMIEGARWITEDGHEYVARARMLSDGTTWRIVYWLGQFPTR